MKPLIVSATRLEIMSSIAFLEKNNIPYLVTGVGMVATSCSVTKQLMTEKYDCIINVGIAGALDSSLKIGQLVEVFEDNLSELGAEDHDQFIKVEDLGFGVSQFTPIPPYNINTQLTKGIGITVNTTHGNEQSIKKIKEIYPDATTESMEGAAVFYVANEFGVSCLQVRAISNYVEKRDKSNWNIPLAIQNLNDWLQFHLRKHY